MKKNILVTAYAVNPFKGSEDGIGWNIIRHLASHSNIVAITRRNNEVNIVHYLKQHPLKDDEQLTFAYFDLPRWLSFWKKGNRGALIYHYLWHLGVVFFIKKKKFQFDLAHHLNFNSDWSPTFLWLLGKPLVWGPLGHHPKIPRPYIQQYGKKAWLKDRLVWFAKGVFWTFDPFLKISKRKADKVIGLNSSVFEKLDVPTQKQCIIPAMGTDSPIKPTFKNEKFQVLSIGRFVPLKGFDLTIRSYADCYHRQNSEVKKNLQLTLIGKGPEKERLLQIAKDCRLPKTAIRFVDWLTQVELSRFFSASKLFLFPSHEGAGMVVAEALSHGLPVLCFDNYGPGECVDESCAIKVPYSDYGQSVQSFSTALEWLLHEPKLRDEMAENAFKYYQKKFTWQVKAERIQAIYDEILLPFSASSTLSAGSTA